MKIAETSRKNCGGRIGKLTLYRNKPVANKEVPLWLYRSHYFYAISLKK